MYAIMNCRMGSEKGGQTNADILSFERERENKAVLEPAEPTSPVLSSPQPFQLQEYQMVRDLTKKEDSRPPSPCHQWTAGIFLGLTNTFT